MQPGTLGTDVLNCVNEITVKPWTWDLQIPGGGAWLTGAEARGVASVC